jgi:DNA-entry nuclease
VIGKKSFSEREIKIKRVLISVLLLLAVLITGYNHITQEETYFDSSDIPKYNGKLYIPINGNEPFFENEITSKEYEEYSELDSLGRCGAALACLGKGTMPKEDEERKSISSIRPPGWHTVKYDIISGKYLYHRSHLIGWQLSAENANKRNLITATAYFNVTGMLPFENQVADYIEETGDRVLYRVTPIYKGRELVARGVLIEARSVSDNGSSLEFCVFVYNVQPGIVINYLDGTSRLEN